MAYEVRIIDWSSDVCSSDLAQVSIRLKTGRTHSRWRTARISASVTPPVMAQAVSWIRPEPRATARRVPAGRGADCGESEDRKRVGEGKMLYVRVTLGGCRVIQKKSKKKKNADKYQIP